LIRKLLSDEVQSFIKDHHSADPHQILLKHRSVSGLPVSIVVDQLIGRRKAYEKLPSWYRHESVLYPPALNIEQASSEEAALIKVAFLQNKIGDLSHKTLLDLTGGFGIDSYFFSKVFKTVHFVEPNSELLEISKHNHSVLGTSNIHYYNTFAEAFLENSPITSFDIIFLDPSRRIAGDKKVFSLTECEPNIVTLQQDIRKHSAHLLVKTSPLLDVQVGLNEVSFVKDIVITSIQNECKELLFFCEQNFKSEVTITAVNVNGKDANFSFLMSEERSAENVYSDPLKYLYEPNSSLLKSGAFKILGVVFDFPKLHPNTHLFTSSSFKDQFPGRVFEIESVIKPDPKRLMEYFEDGKANVFTRNYPLTVNEIRKKYGLKDGGDKYLIGCSGVNKKFLLVARRVR
jgi:hypothetical protein